jgi:hypothetical protein
MKLRFVLAALALLLPCIGWAQENLTEEEKGWLANARRTEENGWLHIKIAGEPFARGFQHGYLVAAEFKDAWRVYDAMTLETMGLGLDFFVEKAAAMHKPQIPPEQLDEMRGIAAGLSKAGVQTTLDQIIGWNAYMEITGYWWPTVAAQYKGAAPGAQQGMSKAKSHCSAFIATGSATTDGKIVIGHESFTEFWNGQYMNIILDIMPTEGHRMVMQTSPGWIASMTDFWVTSGGLVIVETTIVGFVGYDTTKVPEYVRARKASQYASSIDEWVKLIDAANNGGYANSWLIGDIKTNEIAKYEQGLIYTNLKKKSNGWFFGDNAPDDPRIRNLESSDVGYNDIRQQTGARRMRWPQLLAEYEGRINAETGQKILGDTFDVYLMRIEPSSRTISAHYDTDPQPYVSDPNAVWNEPFYPAGSVDGKVTTADGAKTMSMWGRFGRADGLEFDAEAFLRIHPQWNWQEGYLKSRPHRPWTYFDGGK